MADFIFRKRGESTWYVRLAVPMDVQKPIGKKVFVQSLKTTSRTEAVHASHAHLALWRNQIQRARKAKEAPEGWQEAIVAATTEIESLIQRQKRGLIGEVVPPIAVTDADVQAFKQANPDLVARLEGWEAMQADNDIAGDLRLQDALHVGFKVMLERAFNTKHSLTLDQQQELVSLIDSPASYRKKSPLTKARLVSFRTYRLGQNIAQKTVDQQESKLQKLSEYLTSNQAPLDTDTVASWLNSLELASKTLTQYLLAGSVFWKWANRYDEHWRAEYKDRVNPFENHDLPKVRGKAKAEGKRKDFSLENLAMLHDAATKSGQHVLADLILLGVYTGARIEELCKLTKENVITIEDVQCFDIPDSKTLAGIRFVPIHPALKIVVNRLLRDSIDGFLVYSKSRNKYGNRSDPLSKAFGRLKTAHGFGKQHVFHSIRGTVVTQLLRANVRGTLIAEIVGHETGTVTFDVYSQGASPLQKLKAISKLPRLKPPANTGTTPPVT
ncbi:tyrosine-type recombinase/integrase [Pseudomonas japonica]|uniref:tyrosine-type recombinase/integrase n=1 Tax=Pseudomonas japonica TaxID=256466 RepID=UPI003A86F9BD